MKSMEQKEENAWYSTWFDSPFYHILYQHRNQEEAENAVSNLIKHLSVPAGSEVMDLCCGKGRHSVFLEKAGNIVTGLDLSSSNIAACKAFENEHLTFEEHDMRQPYSRKSFDYIFNLFTSFGYFDDAGNEQSLHAIRHALKPKGKLLIDFLNVNPVIKQLPLQETKVLNGISFHIYKSYENQKIIKKIAFQHEGNDYQFQEEVNALQLSDFERYFERTGLKLSAVYGDYNGQSFNDGDSKRLILLAEIK
ncbi:MAG: class I SAM-dependent methyltransferase [Bacteroidota bacterium]